MKRILSFTAAVAIFVLALQMQIPAKETYAPAQLEQTASAAQPETEQEQEVYYKRNYSYYNDTYLRLVNVDHPLPDDYVPPEVVKIKNSSYKMEPEAAKAVREMVDDMKAVGLKPKITSTFRTYEKQVELHERKVAQMRKKYGSSKTEEEARAIAATIVAIPNTSEHQTGLAVDIVGPDGTTDNFEGTAEAKWLEENSWKYGYILRYPVDKTEVTKIIYEPWHFRYVGVENAKAIYESGLCLEEYIERLVTGK